MRISTDEFIAKVQSLPKSFFNYSLESIVDEIILDIRKLLDEDLMRVEPEILDEISMLIDKIGKKKSVFDGFFYDLFGIERDEQRYKKRLDYLLDILHSDANKLEIDIKKCKNSNKKIQNIIEYLQEVKEKLLILYENNTLNKNEIFIKEIDDKIKLLNNYSTALSLREINLLEMKKIYKILKIKGY